MVGIGEENVLIELFPGEGDIYSEVGYRKFLKWMFSLYLKSIKNNKIFVFLWILLSLLVSLIPPVLIYLNIIVIDQVTLISIESQPMFYVMVFIAIVCILQLSSVVFDLIGNYMYDIVKRETSYGVQKNFYLTLTKIKMDRFEDNVFLRRLRKASEALQEDGFSLLKNMVDLVANLVGIIGITVTMFLVHWSLPLASIISTIPQLLIILIFKKRRFKMEWDNTPILNEMIYTAGLFTDRGSQKEIKVFGSDSFLIKRWSGLFYDYTAKQIHLQKSESQLRALSAMLLQFVSFASAFFLIHMVTYESLTVGAYVSLTTAITMIQRSMEMFWSNLGRISEMKLSMSQMMSILDEYPLDNELEEWQNERINNISFENVFYRYPGSQNYALDGIDLFIQKGEKIAIVGENGSGKTTLINILLGLYTEFDGKMKVNGQLMNEKNIESYRKRISAILQDYMRYIYSIYDNVMIGASEANEKLSDEYVMHILNQVGFSKKIEELESGIHTKLDKSFDAGIDLSGGQWQRLAIARGLIKASDVIVLDEPTSALDPVAEVEVFKLFSELAVDKTMIMISHRLGITRLADRIILMENGKIKDIGTHDFLIKNNIQYKVMFEKQAEWYN